MDRNPGVACKKATSSTRKYLGWKTHHFFIRAWIRFCSLSWTNKVSPERNPRQNTLYAGHITSFRKSLELQDFGFYELDE